MTRLILFLGALLGVFVADSVLGAQLRPEMIVSMQNRSASVPGPQLHLATEVLKESYCDGPDTELLTLRLLLRLTFKNVGTQTIILERGSKSAPTIRISKTREDALANRFEMTINNYIITGSSKGRKFPKRPPLGSFVVLQPGQVYKTISHASVFVPRSHPVAKMINPGNYFLQIGVWTWEGSEREAKLRRTAWRSEGSLWSESVFSEPMPFRVLSEPKPEDCQCDTSNVTEDEAISIATEHMRASNRSSTSYKPLVAPQACEWQVVFEPEDKDPNKLNFVYVIDKNTGKILEELQ